MSRQERRLLATLVDYLQEKLARADDVVCTCPTCDVSTVVDRTATMKGWDKYCPIHGTPPPVTAEIETRG